MIRLVTLLINLASLYGLDVLHIVQENILKCQTTGQADCQDPKNIQCEQNYFLFDNYIAKGSNFTQQYCVKWYYPFQINVSPYQNYDDPLTLYCMDCVENPYTWDKTRQCTYDYQILNGVASDGVYTRVDRSSSELYYVDLQQQNSELQYVAITYLCEGCDYFCDNTTILDASSKCSLIISTHNAYDIGHTTVSCLPGYFANLGICQNCLENCESCDLTGCKVVAAGFYASTTVNGTFIIECSSTIPNCITCIYDQLSQVLQCLSCSKDSSGNQWITSLNLKSCELCDAYCQRCEYTTYDQQVISMNVAMLIYPTRFSYTSEFIQKNPQLYIKKCRQCSIKDYIFSSNGIQCEQCSVYSCQRCMYSYQSTSKNGIITNYTTMDLDYIPTTSSLSQLCYRCHGGYSLTYNKSACYYVINSNLIQNCSTYQYTDVMNTVMICVQCNNTFFYNLQTRQCQIHDPNAQLLTGYTLQSGLYVISKQTPNYIANLINSLSYITCSTYLSHCLECYLYESLDDVQTSNKITSAYIYQCATCDIGYYADFFTGLCVLCKTSDQIQSCQDCSQYSLTYNFTNYLQTYPTISSSAKSRLQSIEPVITKPMCFNCISGYTFLSSINDCDTCGGNCFTDSCQTTTSETYCKKCWPPNGDFISRSLSVDHNQCIDCPNNCEACRVRTLQETNSVNPDFNTTYTALAKYSLFCYKPASGSFYDTILGMPISCASRKSCYKSATLDIQLFCSASDFVVASQAGVLDSSLIYGLELFYQSDFGIPVISFGLIDNSDTYTSYNSIVLQELSLNINLISPSQTNLSCSIPSETNLQILFSKNIFSLKNLVVTLQGSLYTDSSSYNQTQNTIVTITSYLNLLYLRNIIINGLTFIYPLACTRAVQIQMMSSTIPIVWGLSIQQNGLTKLKLKSCTFGANASYLLQMNTSNTFSTNDKLLFQFKMNNIYDLSMINVTMNYNNFTYNQNTNPLSRTYDVPQLIQKSTFIDGLLIIGLGLYGTPLFEANDIFTISQQIQIGRNGLTLKFCNFYNGGDIFGEGANSSSSTGQIDVDRMVLQYCSFQLSSIFSFKSNINNGTSIRNVDIIGCNFTDQSYAFYMNNLQLTNIYAYMLTISSSSSIIKTQSNIPDNYQILSNSLDLELKQIHFSNIQCETPGCLVSLTSPVNSINLKSNVTINRMIIESTNIMGIDTSVLQSVSSALVQLKDLNIITIANLKSDNNLAIVIVYMYTVGGVRFYDCLFDSSQSQNNSLKSQKNLTNNLMPVTINCLQAKAALQQYNYIQIYVNQFLYGVYMQNVTFQNLLALDNTLIYIQSYDALMVNTSVVHPSFTKQNIENILHKSSLSNYLADNSSEIIEFIGCKFINNRMVASKTNQYSTIFYASSIQNQIIAFVDCLFHLNHLHQLAKLQNVPSATCFAIESINSNVVIISSNFTNNSATQSQYGLVYILASKSLISQTTFINTSTYDKSWNKRLQKSNLNTSQFLKYFEVLANGGNAFITSETIIVQFSNFNNSQGSLGAGLHLYALGVGYVSIRYSTFENQNSSLNAIQQSQGGALYVDSSNSELNLNIISSQFRRCVARKSGGCVFVKTSSSPQQISIKKSSFENCHALTSSFMEVVFALTSTQLPIVSFDEIIVSQELKLIQMFYYSVPGLKAEELNTLLKFNSIYYQYYGAFILINSKISNIFYTSSLNLQYMIYIDIQSVIITRASLFWLPLMVIHLSETTAAQIVISKLEINNIDEFLSQSDNLEACYKAQPVDTINQIICRQISRILQSTTNAITHTSSVTNSTSSSAKPAALSAINHISEESGEEIQQSINPGLQKSSCHGSTPFYDQRYSDTFYQYYNDILNEPIKYGYEDLINDVQWSEEDSMSYEESVANFDLDYVPKSFTWIDDVSSNYMDCQLRTLLQAQSSESPMALISIDALSIIQTLTISEINVINNNCSRCFGGLIQVFKIDTTTQNPLVRIIDATCENNTAGFYGCFTFSSAQSILAMDNTFGYSNSTAITERLLQSEIHNRNLQQNTEGSTLQDLQLLAHAIYIQQSIFLNNRANVGAGISVFGLNSLIFNAQFVDNKANYMGAGLFFYNTKLKNTMANLYLYDISFQGNIAQVGGGLMLVNISIGDTTQWKVSFSKNIGLSYAADIAEYPQQLSIQTSIGITLPTATFMNKDGNRDPNGNINNTLDQIIDFVNISSYNVLGYPGIAQNLIIPSGQSISSYKYFHASTHEQVPYNYIFRVVNLNKLHQQISSIDSYQTCIVSGRRQTINKFNDTKPFFTNYTTTNPFRYNIDKGAFDFDDMIVIFDPKFPATEYLQLKFQCTSIKIPVYSVDPPYNITGYNSNYLLYVNVSTFPCQLGTDDGRCISCGENSNTFSVDPQSLVCTPIDKSTMVDVNPFTIQTKPGYWHPYDTSPTLTYCLNFDQNCAGGWSSGMQSCYVGHDGALCESCDLTGSLNGESWAQSAQYKCGKCSELLSQNTSIIIGISIFTLLSIVASVVGNYEIIEHFIRNQVLVSIGVLVRDRDSGLAILVKIFTNYFQIISAVATFQLSLPQAFSDSVSNVGNPVKSMAVSYDCFFITMTHIEVLYFRIIWAMLMPFFYLCIFLISYFVAVLLKKAPYRISVIYTTFIYMFIYLQPNLIGGFMSLASQRQISGYPWVQADVRYRFDSPQHTAWVAAFVAPNLVLWACLLPFGLLISLIQNRSTLGSNHTRERWGYFYNEYREEAYYWEFIKIFQKEMIIIFLMYFQDTIIVKGLLIFFMIFIYGGIALLIKPYQSKLLNVLDIESTMICAVSMSGGVLSYAANIYSLTGLSVLLIVIVALINIIFIFQMVGILFHGYVAKFDDKLDAIRLYIITKKPDLVQQHPWLRKSMIIQKEMRIRINYLWAQLRYETRQGIKRKRLDIHAPLFEIREFKVQEIIKFQNHISDVDEKECLIGENQQHSEPEEAIPVEHLSTKNLTSILTSFQRIVITPSAGSRGSSPIIINSSKIYPTDNLDQEDLIKEI